MSNEQRIRDQLRRWAEELVDLTRRNRLLYFKHTQSASLGFAQDAVTVLSRLEGKGWGFHLPPPPPEDEAELESYRPGSPAVDELVVQMTPVRYGPKIERGLKNLAAKAQAEFLDAGIWVLYLGLGQLHWKDVDGKDASSPLYLMPVRLEQIGADQRWRLSYSDDGEPALNPALAVKLEKDFNIVLPGLDELSDADLPNVLAAVRDATAGSGWTVSDEAVLTTFTFQKEVIYRDLRDNEDEIAGHPMVGLLAEGPSSAIAVDLDFAKEPEETLDERHPPEELACVVDADATQRQCLVAARAGRSFVMDGPPGTGKSQTITNVIAQLLADKKTVLFVSEKAAALEVVENRLAELKLDPFVLPLHSHKATRKAVAQELGKALHERPTARPRLGSADRAQLRRDREKLTAYAVAVNRQRRPLDRSLHDVIGRIAQLDRLPQVPIPEVDTTDLDPVRLSELRSIADQLGRAWGPVERGTDFLWRDLQDATTGPGREADLRRRIQQADRCLDAEQTAVANVCAELHLANDYTPATTPDLVDMLRLVEERKHVDASMLTTDDFAGVADNACDLATSLREHAELTAELDEMATRWRNLDPGLSSQLAVLRSQLTDLDPPIRLLDQSTESVVGGLQQAVVRLQVIVAGMRESVEVLAEAFGIDVAPSLDLLSRLVELGRLAGSPTPPEPEWLNPVFRDALEEARRVLADLLVTYRARREALANVFTEDVLGLDLQALNVRFAEVHTGLKKLGGAYRSDKKALAAATVSGRVTKDVIAKLDEALEWQGLAARLSQAESRHGPSLGARYYPSRADADLDEIERAVELADQAIRLAAGDVAPEDLAKQVGLHKQPDPRLPLVVEEVSGALEQFEAVTFPDGIVDLAALRSLDLDSLESWLADAGNRLHWLRDVMAQVTLGADTVPDLATAKTLLDLCVRHASTTDTIDEARNACQPHFGSWIEDLWEANHVDVTVEWASRLRTAMGGKLRPRTAAAILRSELGAQELHDAVTARQKASSSLLGEFASSYADELGAELEGSFDGAYELLEQLATSIADLIEWESYSQSRASLAATGWEATVWACEAQRIPGVHVGDVVERTVLQRWVDQTFASDSSLEPKRAVDRDNLRQEFRRLDEALVKDTAATVINACSDRRPKTLVGQAGIINQQSQLKRRHKPVRRLLTEAGEAAQRLKPCFMMSPLSVSQFLPPGLRFDVVIFDEASQVREADAICCIYRGDQLIVAGDPKQLPPTSFFDRVADTAEEDLDDEILDFESVLDRCKAQGFPGLPLEWHYRSRHESLITFSNRSFYEGRLHTFPGAVFERPDLGVELFTVNGTYQRGGTRDNPVEAEAVVDRVLHHRRAHPELTLGVVALSSAQQSCIEAAIERRSATEAELRELVSDDRLDGFFVKNLENVQGDERDLIIMSVGYGPDENGKFTMNFGPMNRAGGERRLNVAVTRARSRVEVVASFRPGEIDSTNATIRHLARYLDYADRGVAALALDLEDSEGDAESPFEEEVLRSILSFGYDPVPQVGVAGYRIDIGVRHPNQPGSFVLGVECDGAAYHSSKVARDRDRLRQQVLEGLDWSIHRIWSTAWFTDRAGQEERLRQAIENAIQGGPPKSAVVDDHSVDVSVEEHDFDDYPEWMYFYEPPKLPAHHSSQEFTDPGSRPIIVRQIGEVLDSTSPVHQDHVLDALRDAWGIGRAGSRVRDAFKRAVQHAVSSGRAEIDGEFLRLPDDEIFVRGPAVDDPAPRRVGAVHPEERALAALKLLEDAGAAAYDELRQAWARLFGWRRVGTDIEFAFDDAIDTLTGRSLVTLESNLLRLTK